MSTISSLSQDLTLASVEARLGTTARAAGSNGNSDSAATVSQLEAVEVPMEIQIAWDDANLTPETLFALLMNHTVPMQVSDLYFACEREAVIVTARHLGIVKRVARLPFDVGHRCIGHVRAMSRLRHAERHHPQDGRWLYSLQDGSHVDLRINTMPTMFGESLALRLIGRDQELRNLETLGFVGPQLGILLSKLSANSGLVLVTGPTGSGKTTTLYACLHYLNNGRRKIHTIEDPVEYAVPGTYQTQVDHQTISAGVDFPEMLRGVIRQGPDVVMIGEVRDKATAETAVRAANSGQLIFATLHASTAAAAVQSLLSLGVSPYFLCTSLQAVLSQRLVRVLNERTRTPLDMTYQAEVFAEVAPWLDSAAPVQAYAANAGGDSNDGYCGRTGVLELMTLTPAIRELILQMRPAAEIQRRAIDEGMIDFRRAALIKVAQGITTFDEMQRVLPETEWGADD